VAVVNFVAVPGVVDDEITVQSRGFVGVARSSAQPTGRLDTQICGSAYTPSELGIRLVA